MQNCDPGAAARPIHDAGRHVQRSTLFGGRLPAAAGEIPGDLHREHGAQAFRPCRRRCVRVQLAGLFGRCACASLLQHTFGSPVLAVRARCSGALAACRARRNGQEHLIRIVLRARRAFARSHPHRAPAFIEPLRASASRSFGRAAAAAALRVCDQDPDRADDSPARRRHSCPRAPERAFCYPFPRSMSDRIPARAEECHEISQA